MKTTVLCQDKSQYDMVYNQTTIDYLIKNAGYDGFCRNKEYVKANKEEFKDTKFIFSTWTMSEFTEEEIKEYFPSLEAVFYCAGSVQYFARPFLNCKIKVYSAWMANAIPVAEYTVSQIILANKGFFKLAGMKEPDDYQKFRTLYFNFRGNYGAKIGIIGAGTIGKLVIKMLKCYKFEVLVFDPFLPDGTAAELGVKKVSLQKLFSECAVVSNHLANNNETKGMLNKALFEKMPPRAAFLNTGRGAQVVEDDLISVLKDRPDLTAILDVSEPEPPKADSELYKLKNCILTPHIAGSNGDELYRMAEYMVDEFENYTNNRNCNYEVTLKMLERMA